MKTKLLGWVCCWLGWTALADAAPVKLEWTVEGVKREALVAWPAKATGAAPLVFVFHGHGGSMQQASRSQPVHELWPEAIVVYPQGLPTPGPLTDPEGKKAGWQLARGGQGDRDLAFFDAMLARLKQERPVDARRIYATGHSNGGGFTYLLWSARREVFAAFAPSAAVSGREATNLRPAPVFHVAGEKDELVKFAWQERMLEAVRRTNQCEAKGTKAADGTVTYASKVGAPLVTYIHSGTHRYPPEATKLIVAFFKAQVRG